MAISLETLQRVDIMQLPPVCLIYGSEKIGKTSLALEFPSPVLLRTSPLEVPPKGVMPSYWDIDNFEQMIEAIAVLYNDDHSYNTIVVDSITSFESQVWEETGSRGDERGNKKSRIEDFGYGKGYKYALDVWKEFMAAIHGVRRDKNMNVVLLAHSKIERFDDPDTVSYDRHTINIHHSESTSERDLIKRGVDLIALIKQDVTISEEDVGFKKTRAIGAGGVSRWIYSVGRPTFEAGNRYGIPEKILYQPGRGYAALAPYLPAQPQTDTKNTATKTAAKLRAEAAA